MGKLAAAPALKRPPKRCIVARWIGTDLDDDDVAAIEAWFADGFSIDNVYDHVRDVMGDPPPFSTSALAGHRARRCGCEDQPLQRSTADG